MQAVGWSRNETQIRDRRLNQDMEVYTMRKWKSAAAFLLACILAGSMTGCGSKALSSEAVADRYEMTEEKAFDNGWGMEAPAAADASLEMAEAEETSGTAMNAQVGELDQSAVAEEGDKAAERKLIRNMNLSLETTGFDDLLQIIEQKVNELGGYIQDSTIDGTPDTGNRYSYLTVRIPVDQLDAFEETIGNSARVLSKNTNVQDVTLSYSDLAAHISALRLEQETLMDMLAKAETVDTIITIQNELTNIRYELESYESQMKILENQIDYSTVSMNIHEVKTPTVQEKEGFLSRVKHTFSNNLQDIGVGIENFFVFFFGNIVGIILFLAIAAGCLFVIRFVFRLLLRKGRKEKKEKEEKEKEEKEE